MSEEITLTDKIIQPFWNLLGRCNIMPNQVPTVNEDYIDDLNSFAIKNFKTQRAVINLNNDFTIVGDIHGSIEDLLKIFSLFGKPPETKYLFLGDYVDRGGYSVAVISLLLALSVRYPFAVYLLRGNHEFAHINRAYGFYDEIMRRYEDPSIWESYNRVFSYMPFIAIINNSIICVHGGLSPSIKSVKFISRVHLPISTYEGMNYISDLVWSDPSDDVEEYKVNGRGSGVLFGPKAVQNFLNSANLKLMIRAHQCTTNGVHSFAGTLGVTVFSSSNYTGAASNRAGVVRVETSGAVIFFSLSNSEISIAESVNMVLVEGAIGLQNPPRAGRRKPRQRRTSTPDMVSRAVSPGEIATSKLAPQKKRKLIRKSASSVTIN